MLAVQIKEEALKLGPVDKIHLTEALLSSLDKPDELVEKKWVDESERRYAAYKKGDLKGIPLDQFYPRLSS
jgi:putative addiction module component (TIGR02574 family)